MTLNNLLALNFDGPHSPGYIRRYALLDSLNGNPALGFTGVNDRVMRGGVHMVESYEDAAVKTLRKLLTEQGYSKRTVGTMATRLRVSQDEVRRLLVQAGAVSSDGRNGVEYWRLLDNS